VVESPRHPGMKNGFEWFCMNCKGFVHRIEVAVTDIVKEPPPLCEQFCAEPKARTCQECGAVHPDKVPPPGWVEISSRKPRLRLAQACL